MHALRVSVVVPVYNGAPFIQRSLDSVFAQTFSAKEIIVVDDGSTDATPEILCRNRPAIRVITQQHAGRSVARNAGIREAIGDYVAFLDADDQFWPKHLEQLVSAVRLSGAEIVYDVIGPPFFLPHEYLPRQPYGARVYKHLACCRIWTVNAMVRRDWIGQHNILFDTDLCVGEDAAFFWKMILLGARIGYIRRIGTTIGIHDGNTTGDPGKTLVASLAAYDSLDRFVQDRGLRLTWNMRRQIAMGRRHKEIMSELISQHASPPLPKQRIAAVMRMLLSFRPTRPVERVRCLLALLTIIVPCLMQSHRIQRMILGFGVSRSRFVDPASFRGGR